MRTATLLLFGAALAIAAPAAAQCTGTAGVDYTEVTIRDINTLPDGNVDQLNAGGADLTIAQIQPLLRPALNGERVQFTAVLMTDPFKSGIRSLNAEGIPGGIHTFMRDVNATTMGFEGMGTQVVDFSGTGLLQGFFAGDELVVCGEVSVFENTGGSATQIAVESAEFTDNTYGADDPLRQPITITTDDVHDTYDVGGDFQSQIDWSRYEEFNGQFVRFQEIELLIGENTFPDRPNLLYSTPGQESEINQYDTSVCFRNDRGPDYFPTAGSAPDCIDDDFVAPATGIINVQGFLTFQGDDGGFNYAVPDGANFVINPFEEADFEIAVAPPIISLGGGQLATPAGLTVQATVIPGTEGNTVASVTLSYETTSGASDSIVMTNTSGDLYEATIAPLTAGDFVTYSLTAVDNEGNATTPSDEVSRLVVDGAVTSIFQVQATADGGPGDSGITTADPIAFDLDAVVQTAYQTDSGRFQVTIQDDESLSAFSGVLVDFGSTDPMLAVGDRVNITEARVSEFRETTQLSNVTFTVTGSGDRYPAKVVTTDLFNGTDGAATAEQHEGIYLQFNGASVTSTNPDGSSGDFGEFAFSSDGTAANQLRADDGAEAIPDGYNATLTVGQSIDIAGYLAFSFGNYKLIPVALEDITLGGTAVEGGLETASVRIAGTFPNPAVGALRVRFELATAADVSLRVFDTMGREVATVAEGAFGPATHTVDADLSGLATGVYVLRLVASGEVATTRIAIVR